MTFCSSAGAKKLRPNEFRVRIHDIAGIFNTAQVFFKAFSKAYDEELVRIETVQQEAKACREWGKRMKKDKQYLIAQSALRQMTVPQLKHHAQELGIKQPGIGWPTCCPPDGLKESIVQRCLPSMIPMGSSEA